MAPEVRKDRPSFRDSFLLLHQVGHIDKLHTRLWTSTRSSLFLHLLQFALSQHDAYPTRQPGRAEGQGRERTNRTTTPYYTQWLRSGFHPLVPIESEENRQRREKLAASVDPIIRSYTVCSKLGDDNWLTPYLPKMRLPPFNALAIARTGVLTMSGSAYTLEQEFWRVAEEAAEEARIAPYKALLLSKPDFSSNTDSYGSDSNRLSDTGDSDDSDDESDESDDSHSTSGPREKARARKHVVLIVRNC